MLAADVLQATPRAVLRWLGAGAVIVGLHVAGAAWAIYAAPEENFDDEVEGAIVMELAPVVASQRSETPDTTMGPVAEDATPTPPAMEKVSELKPMDIPQFELSAVAPDPEVVTPIAKPVEETKEEPEELKEVQPETVASVETAASQAMAPPLIESREAPNIVAPQVGDSKKDSRAVLTYRKSLNLHLKKHQRYPAEARQRGQQGSVLIEFAIDRTGRAISKKVSQPSGIASLDQEALSAVDRASPFPLPPDEEPGEVLEYSMQIHFKIR